VDSDPTLIARLEGRKRMKRTVCALATAAALGLGTVALSGPALADGARTAIGGLPAPAYGWGPGYGYYGNGPAYYGEYAPLAYDSYAFSYEYPAYTGGDVTAIAVDLFNYRFRHHRVVGQGVVYYRG